MKVKIFRIEVLFSPPIDPTTVDINTYVPAVKFPKLNHNLRS